MGRSNLVFVIDGVSGVACGTAISLGLQNGSAQSPFELEYRNKENGADQEYHAFGEGASGEPDEHHEGNPGGQTKGLAQISQSIGVATTYISDQGQKKNS